MNERRKRNWRCNKGIKKSNHINKEKRRVLKRNPKREPKNMWTIESWVGLAKRRIRFKKSLGEVWEEFNYIK